MSVYQMEATSGKYPKVNVDAAREQVATYLDVRGFPIEAVLEMRAFRPDQDGAKQYWWTPLEFIEPPALGIMADLNEKGYGIYIGANERTRRNGGKDGDVKVARAAFSDADGNLDEVERLLAAAGVPESSMRIITRGPDDGHAHDYWLFSALIEDMATFRLIQRIIIDTAHSDPRITNPSRVMRLPGFWNTKADPPALVQIVRADKSLRFEPGHFLELRDSGRFGIPSAPLANPPAQGGGIPPGPPSGSPTKPKGTERDGDNGEHRAHRDYREHREEQKPSLAMASVVSVPLCPSLCAGDICEIPGVQAAIEACQPDKVGRREDALWVLARRLKAISELCDLPVKALRPIVRAWHTRAVGTIGTKPWDESWIAFQRAWERVKVPYGQGIAQTALQRAKEKGPPKCAEEYDLPETRLLLGIFRELQAIQGDKPVFLSCRLAAHLVGMPEKYGKLNNIINMLQADGLLVRIAPGTEFKSPRYRYVGGE